MEDSVEQSVRNEVDGEWWRVKRLIVEVGDQLDAELGHVEEGGDEIAIDQVVEVLTAHARQIGVDGDGARAVGARGRRRIDTAHVDRCRLSAPQHGLIGVGVDERGEERIVRVLGVDQEGQAAGALVVVEADGERRHVVLLDARVELDREYVEAEEEHGQQDLGERELEVATRVDEPLGEQSGKLLPESHKRLAQVGARRANPQAVVFGIRIRIIIDHRGVDAKRSLRQLFPVSILHFFFDALFLFDPDLFYGKLNYAFLL